MLFYYFKDLNKYESAQLIQFRGSSMIIKIGLIKLLIFIQQFRKKNMSAGVRFYGRLNNVLYLLSETVPNTSPEFYGQNKVADIISAVIEKESKHRHIRPQIENSSKNNFRTSPPGHFPRSHGFLQTW